MKLEHAVFYNDLARNVKKQKSFTLTGLTTFCRLLLVNYIKKLSGKKILFITSSEQSALRYSSDLERIFGIQALTLPYQNISPYEVVAENIYDYQKQVSVLLTKPDVVIAPAKVLMEKFPQENFFKKNSLCLKIGDNISQSALLKQLTKFGYKRSTMVSDIGEFSIRGDIADIYSLDENPVRIEFWGDEIVDIRFFNNETQKSVEKIQSICIRPIYKFVVPDKSPVDLPQELAEKLQNEGYFEGINVYQSYFNSELVSIFDYFNDYILIFDELAELSAKLQQIEDSFINAYQEGLKNGLLLPLRETNHFSTQELIQKEAAFQKIYFNNFLSDENNEVIDIDASNVQIFDANMDALADFISKRKGNDNLCEKKVCKNQNQRVSNNSSNRLPGTRKRNTCGVWYF